MLSAQFDSYEAEDNSGNHNFMIQKNVCALLVSTYCIIIIPIKGAVGGMNVHTRLQSSE